MDSSLSISNSLDKESVVEQTSLTYASLEEAKRRGNDSISNERIQTGAVLLETYEVTDGPFSGGMGSVWRVHHNSWDTDLAMKRPHPKYFAEGSERRKEFFIKECENWINLGLHPNIVSCYYIREIGGVPSIFSEWMDGGSLKDRIADGSLYKGTDAEVRERIVDIALQAMFGLEYSHENKLIHQDMKPGNLLLSGNWDAKVADFGLANAITSLEKGQSDAAAPAGYTLAYCPSEQAEGAAPEPWMDVYAWALTVFEMYAGKRLWETGAMARDHFEEYPAQCRIRIPGKLTALLRSCLSGNIKSFKEIEDDLASVYTEETGKMYLRATGKASDTSDILNNKALSFIDLGMPDRADELLQSAIKAKNNAENAVFNYALLRWRRGMISDDECLQFIREHLGYQEEKCGAIEEERGFDPLMSVHDVTPPLNKEASRYEFVPISSPRYLGIYETKDYSNPLSTDCFYLLGYNEDSSSWEIVQTVVTGNIERYELDFDTALVSHDTLLYRTGKECLELHYFDDDLPYEDITVSENDVFLADEAENILKVTVTEETGDNGVSRSFHASFYDSPGKLKENTPYQETTFRTEGDDFFYQLYAAKDNLFYLDEKEIIACGLPSGKCTKLYSWKDGSEEFVDALCHGGTLYVLTDREILIFDKDNITRIALGHADAYSGKLGITPDKKYLIVTFSDSRDRALVGFYDTALRRCIATYCDAADKIEWAYKEVKAVDSSHIEVHIIQKIYEVPKYGEYTTRYEYCIKDIPVPKPGELCSWQLSRIRSLNERLEADRKFEKRLTKIRQKLAGGSVPAALELIEDVRGMEGYEQNLRLWELNCSAGRGQEITGIRYVRPVSTDECALLQESERYPAGEDRILIRKKTDRGKKTEYQLYRWTTGELLFTYPAASDAVFGCISSDDNYAVILEQIRSDHFTIARFNLQSGAAERISVPAALKPDQFEAASHDRRIVIVVPGHEILADKNAVARITESTGETGCKRLICFSRNGKYLAAALASSYDGSRTSVALYPADDYFKGTKDSAYSANALGMDRLSVSNSGEILAQFDKSTILFCPDKAPIMVRCVAERDEERYLFSSFAPDEAGFSVVSSDGDLLYFKAKEERDYRIEELGTNHRSNLVYTGRSNMIVLKKSQTVYGSDKIDVNGELVFNNSGNYLIDAGGTLWIIDHNYSDKPKKPLHRPPQMVKKENLEYSKEMKDLMEPETERREGLKMFLEIGIISIVFGLFSLFFLGKLAPEFLRQTVLLGKAMLALGGFAVVFGVINYFHKIV